MTKVIFMGTPKIAASVLETILKLNNIELVGVITQPDRELNRKKEIVYSPVKLLCLQNNLKIFQPIKIGEIYEDIKSLEPNIIITCAYGQFIPQKILDIPTIGCFNLHASILPKYRGGAPIHWAIINGEHETGVTLMKTILKMDAGEMIDVIKCPIPFEETTESLTNKLAQLACELLEKNWTNLANNSFKLISQNEQEVSFALNISKQDTIINFDNNVLNIYNKVRGLYNKPLAIWNYKNTNVKILESKTTSISSSKKPGLITKINSDGIFVATSDYDLQITKLQLPNKNPIEVKTLINGNHIFKVD